MLLCRMDEDPTPPPSRPGSGFRYHVPAPRPRGFFLVLPAGAGGGTAGAGSNAVPGTVGAASNAVPGTVGAASNAGSLLVKPVADADLLLPVDVSTGGAEALSPQSEALISRALSKVQETWNHHHMRQCRRSKNNFVPSPQCKHDWKVQNPRNWIKWKQPKNRYFSCVVLCS